jgi:hypothetical protein
MPRMAGPVLSVAGSLRTLGAGTRALVLPAGARAPSLCRENRRRQTWPEWGVCDRRAARNGGTTLAVASGGYVSGAHRPFDQSAGRP